MQTDSWERRLSVPHIQPATYQSICGSDHLQITHTNHLFFATSTKTLLSHHTDPDYPPSTYENKLFPHPTRASAHIDSRAYSGSSTGLLRALFDTNT